MAKPTRTGLPSRQQILDFIKDSDQPAGKREIARAFGLSGHDKIGLKQLLRDMGDEGLIDSAPGRAFHKMGGVPKVTVLRIVDVNDDIDEEKASAIQDAGIEKVKIRSVLTIVDGKIVYDAGAL